MHTLILIRHGQSVMNLENRFAGWTENDLSPRGIEEAKEAGRLLAREGFSFDGAYTSVLLRATKTLDLVLGEMNLAHIPVTRAWELNERHYGALQGLNKSEVLARYGEAQFAAWRRGYDTPPPALTPEDPRNPAHDVRYKDIDPARLPLTECLADVVARVAPYWETYIAPRVRNGERLMIAAHGNSLRALVKHLDNLSTDDVIALNIPTGIPLLYEFTDALAPIGRRYLGDPDAIAARIAEVQNQGKQA